MQKIACQHPLEQRFCEMYALIVKALPELHKSLPEDQVFSQFAPYQLKQTVTDLFQLLKKHPPIGAEQEEQTWVAMKLRDICYEDVRFNEMLMNYLIRSNNYSQVVGPSLRQIKSQKSLQQEHLEKVFSQIEYEKSRGPQRISEYMTVHIDMDRQLLMKEIGQSYTQSQKLNGKQLIIVLYDLIKSRCTFEKFIKNLSQQRMDEPVKMLFTQQFLLTYLLNNSDTYLRTMILMACSQFMPLPLVSYQPNQKKLFPINNYDGSKNGGGMMMQSSLGKETETPSDRVQIEFLPYVYEELFYCFEKHMAVLAFKVSANPNKSPKGCTSLTNDVFNRSFQTHSESLVNSGCIEIQFDYNFQHPMFVPVADAHGLVEDNILEQVYPLFNIFLIHSFDGEEHQAVANEQIAKINKYIQDPLIFQIIHNESKKTNSFTTSENGEIIKITLGCYSDLIDDTKESLRSIIINRFLQKIGNFQAYESNIKARLDSLQEFSEFNTRFRGYRSRLIQADQEYIERGFNDQQNLTDALNITRNFFEQIEENKEDLQSNKVLPMNVLFKDSCRLEKIMKIDISLNGEQCEEYRKKVELFYQKMNEAEHSPLTQELRKIMDHHNYLGLTSIISKMIKSLVNLNMKSLIDDRQKLYTQVEQIKKEGGDQTEKVRLIKEINSKMEKIQFSNEFIYREYYINELSNLRCSERLPEQPFINYLSLAKLQISQGQPFEIIDGNNYQFIKEVYSKLEADQRQKEEILVVSVIGPQSSGKSLLLNTLFGAEFPTSSGRCTRGIYGCIIDIMSINEDTHFKKILILDSEGIQSSQNQDKEFDRRVVFYILCVSHIVLICNEGEIKKQMEDTIKLAADCIMQVKQQIYQQPQVNIIMNKVQISKDSLLNTTEKLMQSLMEMNNQQNIRKIFTMNDNNVFQLPNAFTETGKEKFISFQPSDNFAQYLDKLRKKIIIFIQQTKKKDKDSQTLKSWFQSAQKFWDFTDGYIKLTQYQSIEERMADKLVLDKAKQLIYENFEDPSIQRDHEQKIHEQVKKAIAKHKDNDMRTIQNIKPDIDQYLNTRKEEIQTSIKNQFDQFIKEQNINEYLKQKREIQLNRQIKQNFLGWESFVFKMFGDFNQQETFFIGCKYLQDAANKKINLNKTEQEAAIIFNSKWDKIITEIKSKLRPDKDIFDDQFNYISQLYRANGGSIINIDQEISLITQYKSLHGQRILMELQQEKAFFFYNSRTVKLSMEEFKEKIDREKHFLSKNIDFFQEFSSQEYYNWKRVVQERFNFEAYEKKITELSQSLSKDPQKQAKMKGITEQKIKQLIDQIKEEADHYNVDIKEQFENQLQSLEKQYIEPLILQQKKLSKELSNIDEKNCIETGVKQYIHSIRNSIELYFQYKKGQYFQRYPEEFQYFDNFNILDVTTSKQLRRDDFSQSKYIKNQEIHDFRQKSVANEIDGLAPINKRLTQYRVNPKFRDQDMYDYLKYLVQSDQSHIPSSSKPVEHALTTLFQLIDKEKLLRSIQSIVLENILINAGGNQHTTVENLVQQLIDADDPNVTQKFCVMNNMIIQKVQQSIEGIVAMINEDMELFNFKVSEQGNYCLHKIAQTYIIRIMSEVIRLIEHAPLYSFIKTKEIERGIFIAKLTSNDTEMDIKSAVRTARHLVQIIVKQIKDEQIQAFQNKIKMDQDLINIKNYFIQDIERQMLKIVDEELPNPFYIDGCIDNIYLRKIIRFFNNREEEKMGEDYFQNNPELQNVDDQLQFSPEEIIKFYVEPIEFLKKKFDQQWTTLTNNEIRRAKLKYEDRKKQIKINFNKYFQQFLDQIKSKNLQQATSIFTPKIQDLSLNNIAYQAVKIYCQKAMAIYIGNIVGKSESVNTDIKVGNYEMITQRYISLVNHSDIRIQLISDFGAELQKIIQNQQVSNIYIFIETLKLEINKAFDIQNQRAQSINLQHNELIGNLYQVMKDRIVGCDQMCPMCRCQCDQSHDGDALADRIHRCEKGHRIQGFGGSRQTNNNKVIASSCNELVNQDIVMWQGESMKWKKLKALIYNESRWDLEDMNQVASKTIQQKNMKIWNLIGPVICDYHRQTKKIKIRFVEAVMDAKIVDLQKTFYLLMIDNSASMRQQDSNGKSRWINLTSAVAQFADTIQKNAILQKQSKISIIHFSQSAEVYNDAQAISYNLLSALQPLGWEKDFDSPLQMAKTLMEKYHKSYDSFVVVMMSDGESVFPSVGVQDINKSRARSKLKFKSIAYCCGSNCLRKIAEDLGGTSEEILEPKELTSAFLQMIPSLYSQ